MWSTDWTMDQLSSDCNNVTLDAQAQQHVEFDADFCAEQNPHNVEVFGLSDVSTWLRRMEQRQQRALRAGKLKLVHKIHREIDLVLAKAETHGPTGPQAAFCNGEVDEEPLELDSIWGSDWVSLAVTCGGA